MQPVFNRTKVIATMGPACADKSLLRDMLFAGVDVCRLNMSHGDYDSHEFFIRTVRELNREHELYVSLLLDLQGPKLRVGVLKEPISLEPGQILTFDSRLKEQVDERVPVDYPSFSRDVKPGDTILLDDGAITMKVLDTDKQYQVTARVIHGKVLQSRKGINLPDSEVSLPSLTEKDREDLLFGLSHGVEWVALSFVRKPEDIFELKEILREKGSQAKIVAKIEKPQALRHINAIIEAADAVMVARGDLGVEIPIEEVPFWQKIIVRRCNAAAKPVIVATQMLNSMIEHNRPTRAEVTDVANAVLDGADAVMLSGETSVGKFPLEAVQYMQKIITKAEKEPSLYDRYQEVSPRSKTFYSDAICLAACKLATGIRANAIISMTRTGYTAFQISRHRPRSPIFIFTDNRPIINALNLVWGVRAFYYDRFVGTNETINDVINILKKKGFLKEGDVVINTATIPLHEGGRTNMIKYTIVK